MLLRGIIRTIKCHIESTTQEPLSDETWLVEHAGCILSRCQKGRDGKTPFERLHGKKPTQEFVLFGEKVLAKQITTDPMDRMDPRYRYGIWLGMRNNSAECLICNADGVLRAREIRRLEPPSRWDTEAIKKRNWNILENDRRQMDSVHADQKFEWTQSQSLRCHSRVHECRGRESPSKTLTNSEPRLDNKRAQAHSDRC